MAFTNINKPSDNTSELLIESTYNLLIGEGYTLLIESSGEWVEESKHSAVFTNASKS